MPTKRVWLGHAPDVPQVDRIELDAAAVVAEGTDLIFKVNGKELPVENPHPVVDDDTAAAGDTAGVLTLLQAAEAAINSSEIPEFAELEALTESPDTDPESPYHRMSVSSREPGIPFTLQVSAPNPTIDVDVVQAGAPGINEIQQLYFEPDPTQGYFTITWDLGSGNETSNNINVPLTAELVKAAMVAGMASITDDNLLVTGAGTPGDPFQFELQDDLAETSVALMTVNVTNLLGVGGVVHIGTIQNGSDGSGTGALFQNDTFTEATQTLITSHTSDSGHSWSVTGPEPSVSISSLPNQLAFVGNNPNASGTTLLRLSENTHADFDASVQFNHMSAGANKYGILFRYLDDNNYLMAHTAHIDGVTFRIQIQKVEAGIPITLATVDADNVNTLGSNMWGEMRLFVQGDEITCTVVVSDVNETISATSSFNNTEKLHGLYADRPVTSQGYMLFDALEFRETNTQNEKQSVWVNAQGGSFTLTRPETGNPTSGIAHDSSPANVQTRLEGIYGVGNVSVTGAGTAGDPWIVEFIGDLAATNLQQMTGDGTSLLAVVVATITEFQDGSPPTDTIWDITIHGTTSGDFHFTFKGRPTPDIAYGAVAATVLAALEALAPGDFSGLWTVVDTGIGSADYRITAGGRLAGEPQLLTAHNEDLVGSALGITHVTIQQATGRNWIDNPVNYRDVATGLPGLPETGDELFVQTGDETSSLRYGSLAGRQLKRFILGSLFSGHIGLPEVNPAGYAEYRPTHITLEFEAGTQSPDDPNILIGVEQGQGSGLVRIKTGTDEVHIRVERTGGPAEDARPSFCWDGQNAANTLNLIEGFVGTAVFAFAEADLDHVTQRGGLLRLGEGTDIGSGGFDHTAGETLGRATIGGAPVIFGG